MIWIVVQYYPIELTIIFYSYSDIKLKPFAINCVPLSESYPETTTYQAHQVPTHMYQNPHLYVVLEPLPLFESF